ncbi:hypothetical protein KA405_01045 [Patescibacteria group bacterium]|nr:hypothetical protein [Patescibacteria group bacterium]
MAPIFSIFQTNASKGRVHSLHHCGVGIIALPNLTSNGHKNITDAFILSLNTGSISYELTFFALIRTEESFNRSNDHHNNARISSIYPTSDVFGTL